MSSIPLSKGPATHLADKKQAAPSEALPVRSTTARSRIEEEARSVHTERHYDKSARSNKSQERSGRSQDQSNKSPARDDGSQRSRNPSAHSQQSDNRSQRSSNSQNRERSAKSNRSASYQYNKLTSSLVSNPDNLICDDCVNKEMMKHKKDKEAAKREADKEHANRTNADLKKQLEAEKERHLEKLRLYREGVEGQNADLQDKRAKAKAAEAAEKEKLREQMADRSDLIAREKEQAERRDKFRGELADQVDKNHQFRIEQKKLQQEDDQKNHNLLIDDGWRGPHQKALKDYYKNNLLGQMADNDEAKKNNREAQKEADAQYVEEVKAYNERDRAQRAKIEAEKKEVLKNELSKQLDENQGKRDQAAQQKAEEDAMHREKVAFDNEVFYNNLERKKVMVKGHMQDLINQKQDAEAAKKAAEQEAKKPQGTGLHVPQKVVKCYDCAECKASKPVDRMNKRAKKAK